VPELDWYPVGHGVLPTLCGHTGGYEHRYSPSGQPFHVWAKPVPRIADWLLDCVVYLYPSVQDADAGEAAGGTEVTTVPQKRSLKSTSSSESSFPILCRHPSTKRKPWRAYSDTASGGNGFEK
jgi:hypothetical protein